MHATHIGVYAFDLVVASCQKGRDRLLGLLNAEHAIEVAAVAFERYQLYRRAVTPWPFLAVRLMLSEANSWSLRTVDQQRRSLDRLQALWRSRETLSASNSNSFCASMMSPTGTRPSGTNIISVGANRLVEFLDVQLVTMLYAIARTRVATRHLKRAVRRILCALRGDR